MSAACRNCDSDRSLGLRRLCITHAHEAGQALLEALADLVRGWEQHGLDSDALTGARAAIAKAVGK